MLLQQIIPVLMLQFICNKVAVADTDSYLSGISENFKSIAGIGGVLIGRTVAGAMGFGSAGVAVGNLAAESQTFAQNIGATGAGAIIGAKVGTVIAVADTDFNLPEISENLKSIAFIGGVLVACTVVGAVGFGSGGFSAGTLAAASQTPYIVAGSAFAIAVIVVVYTDSCLPEISENLKSIAIIGGVTVVFTAVGAVAFPLVLGSVGFGSGGVAAGSLAAAIQTPHIVAGSAFAILQSIGATGTGVIIGAKAGFVTGVVIWVAGEATRRFVIYFST